MPHRYLVKEFEQFARSTDDSESVMQRLCQRIHAHIPRYNWVGFYLVDKKDPNTLVLGPHTGSFTPTPKITLGQGLCGSAALTRRVVVVDDVTADPRYLSVSDMVRSQISVPISIGGTLFGVMNIESYFVGTFKPTVEREFAESCVRIVASCVERAAVMA
jgi:L-methionine (R)-S-oxide reductase